MDTEEDGAGGGPRHRATHSRQINPGSAGSDSRRWRTTHEHRLVVVKPSGVVSTADLFRYEQTLRTRADIDGYRAFVDLSDVEDFAQPSADQIHILARSFAQACFASASAEPRLALLADRDFLFGLARMFKTYAEGEGAHENSAGVFRTSDEAAQFLQLPRGVLSEHAGETVCLEDS